MKSIGLVAPTLLRLLLLLLVPASPASSSSFAFAFAFFLPPIQRPNLKLLTFQPGQQRSSSCGSRAGSFLHHSHRWGLPVRSASVASDRSAVGSTHTLSAELDRRAYLAEFSGRRASAVAFAVAALATGSFLLSKSRLPIGDTGKHRTSASSSYKRSAASMLGAWRCSGNTNAELIKNLVDANLVRTPRVAKALQATDRGFYTTQEAYEDRPQPIGFRATISAPHMHAHALEVLSPVIPSEGGRVLDVGCGSGYLTGALTRLVGAEGAVFGMDYIPNLVALTKANLDSDDESLLASGKVSLKTGDGWKGWAENGPFDAIHVGAAAETIPEDLVSQLKVGGRMVVPVGPQSSSQMLMQVDRIKDSGPISESYNTEGLMAVVYVPLVNT